MYKFGLNSRHDMFLVPFLGNNQPANLTRSIPASMAPPHNLISYKPFNSTSSPKSPSPTLASIHLVQPLKSVSPIAAIRDTYNIYQYLQIPYCSRRLKRNAISTTSTSKNTQEIQAPSEDHSKPAPLLRHGASNQGTTD